MKSNSKSTDATIRITPERASELLEALTLPDFLKRMEERIKLLEQFRKPTSISQESLVSYNPQDFDDIKNSFKTKKNALILLEQERTKLNAVTFYETKPEDTFTKKISDTAKNISSTIQTTTKKTILDSKISTLTNYFKDSTKFKQYKILSKLNKKYLNLYNELNIFVDEQINNLVNSPSDTQTEKLNNLLKYINLINLDTPQMAEIKEKIVIKLSEYQVKIIPGLNPIGVWTEAKVEITPKENHVKKKSKLATISDGTNPPRATPNKSKKIKYKISSEKDRVELIEKSSRISESDIEKGNQILAQQAAALKEKIANDKIEEIKASTRQLLSELNDLKSKNATTLIITRGLINEASLKIGSAKHDLREAEEEKKKHFEQYTQIKQVNKSILEHASNSDSIYGKKINDKIEKTNQVLNYIFSRDNLFVETINSNPSPHNNSILTRIYRFFTSKLYPAPITHPISIPLGIEAMKTINFKEEKPDASSEERLRHKLSEMKKIADQNLENYTGSDLTKEFYKIFQNLEDIDQTCHSLVKLDKLTKALENFYTLKHYEKQGANISDFKNNSPP